MIFDSHINYANLIWGQNLHSLSRIIISQKKALRIMNFQSRDSHGSPLFRSNHILKLEDKKYLSRIYFLSIRLLIIFFLQSLKVALIFTIITQPHLLLTRYLNHPIELILMERMQSL